MTHAEIVRELFGDFNRGDFDAALAKLDPEVDWGEPPDMPETIGGYRGREGVVAEFGVVRVRQYREIAEARAAATP